MFYSGWTLKHLYAHVNYPEVTALFVAPKCLICLTSLPLNQCPFWIWFERSIAFGFELLAYSNFRQCKSIFNVFTCTCFTGLLSIIKVFTFHIVSSIILKKGFPSPRIYEHYLARRAKFYMKLIVILYIMLLINDTCSYAFTRIKHMELIILSVEDEEDKIKHCQRRPLWS